VPDLARWVEFAGISPGIYGNLDNRLWRVAPKIHETTVLLGGWSLPPASTAYGLAVPARRDCQNCGWKPPLRDGQGRSCA
jgi:hypothetical protein